MVPSSLAHPSNTHCRSSTVSASARILPSRSSMRRTAISTPFPGCGHLSRWRRRRHRPARAPSSGRWSVEEQSEDVLKQLPAELAVSLDKLSKLPDRKLEAVERCLCSHCCRTFSFGDESDFAELVARPERPDLAPAAVHGRLSRDDDEEADAAHLALARHGRTCAELALSELRCQSTQLARTQVAEQRNTPERLFCVRHQPILPAATRNLGSP